ncbi:putative Ig domain-containing protein [Arthrobacter pascens]|uniref:putative Ig domain-containing protein n=1 Tax=Arthrobacter pascens TaxID=1677 RepID=UPI0027D87BB8|nr:putative Ig domain-containing protein [Arthrobacter pascens]
MVKKLLLIAATIFALGVPLLLAPAAWGAITGTPPDTGTVGTAYSYTFTASGVPAPTFTVSSGSLPAGLTLGSAGVLAGIPTSPGTSTYTVTASNGTTPAATTAPLTLTIAAAPVAPAFTASSPPDTGTVGTAYSYTFTASGIPAPTFTVSSGSLPAGLTLSSAGVLAGTPTSPGVSTYTVTASNGTTPAATTAPLTLTITAAPVAPAFTASTPPDTGTVGTAYSYTFTASGVPGPAFAVSSGSLPAGLNLNSFGVLSGTPTSPGTSTFIVTTGRACGCRLWNYVGPTASTGLLTLTINSAQAAPAGTPLASAPVTPAPVGAAQVGSLAQTGQNTVTPLIGGTVMVMLGFAFTLLASRRRSQPRR